MYRIFLIFLFVVLLVGLLVLFARGGECFTTGGSNKNLYLLKNESVYVAQWDDSLRIYVYTLNPVTGEYTGEWIYCLGCVCPFDAITIHFVKQPFNSWVEGDKIQ